MNIDFHKNFMRSYRKLSRKLKDKFNERLKIFVDDSHAPELNNHALHGEYLGCRSINVTGDLRAVYEFRGDGIRFLDIDNHNNLY